MGLEAWWLIVLVGRRHVGCMVVGAGVGGSDTWMMLANIAQPARRSECAGFHR